MVELNVQWKPREENTVFNKSVERVDGVFVFTLFKEGHPILVCLRNIVIDDLSDFIGADRFLHGAALVPDCLVGFGQHLVYSQLLPRIGADDDITALGEKSFRSSKPPAHRKADHQGCMEFPHGHEHQLLIFSILP